MEPERKTVYKTRKDIPENFRKGRWKMDKKRLLRAAAIFFSCMTIYVREGERVKKGDLLFEVDPLLLEEKILYQRQEMEKQRLQVQDAKSQKDVSAQQKANEQAQASEQSSGSVVQEENMVESSLEKALEEKSEAYIQANQELSSLQWQIENEVDQALRSAAAGSYVLKNEMIKTQSSDEEPELLLDINDVDSLPDLNALTDEQDGDDLPDLNTLTDGQNGDDLLDLNAITDGQDTDIIIDEIEIDSRPLNEEEKKQLEQSVRNKYEQKLAAARKKVEVALEEKEAAVISGRAVYSAGIPDPSNSLDRMNEITYEQMELSLQKLEKLKEEYRRR